MPDGYMKGTNGQLIEIIDAKARKGLAKKLPAPATAKVGDYLRISAVNTDGSFTVEAVAAPTVPTTVSAFENDAGYVDEARVNELLAAFPTFEIQVVAELPDAGADKTIYLVPFADDSGSYLEYLYVNGAWEIIGSRSGENGGGGSTALFVAQDTPPADTSVLWIDTSDDSEDPTPGTIDLSCVQTILRNIMTLLKAQVEDEGGTPQAYSIATAGEITAETDALIETLGNAAQAAITGITAVYSGGDVVVGTDLNALTGVVVTAHYDNGTSRTVTGYALSGEIAEGENTVTATYKGFTATFTVTGIAVEIPENGVTQTGSVLVITGGVTATQYSDILGIT